jgi:hypothetical protein
MLAAAVIDTSVFVADAMSEARAASPSKVHRMVVVRELRLVLCQEIRAEIVSVLAKRAGWTAADVDTRFGPVFDRATWVTPVPEEPHHLAAVQGHSADTIVVRTA